MSHGFDFELEPVLEMRSRAEREHQRRVADLERERLAIEQRLSGLQQAILSSKQDLRERLAAGGTAGSGRGAVSLTSVRLQAGAAFGLTAKARQTVLELAGVHRRLEAARAELLKVTTARKAVELLKARRYEQWLAERKRREFVELDEINVTRTARAGAPGAATGIEP